MKKKWYEQSITILDFIALSIFYGIALMLDSTKSLTYLLCVLFGCIILMFFNGRKLK